MLVKLIYLITILSVVFLLIGGTIMRNGFDESNQVEASRVKGAKRILVGGLITAISLFTLQATLPLSAVLLILNFLNISHKIQYVCIAIHFMIFFAPMILVKKSSRKKAYSMYAGNYTMNVIKESLGKKDDEIIDVDYINIENENLEDIDSKN